MWLILEASVNWRRKNLLISNKIAVIILDEYSDTSFCNIIFTKYYTPNKQLWYYCINPMYAAYIPLHYVLLFPRGDTGWHWGL